MSSSKYGPQRLGPREPSATELAMQLATLSEPDLDTYERDLRSEQPGANLQQLCEIERQLYFVSAEQRKRTAASSTQRNPVPPELDSIHLPSPVDEGLPERDDRAWFYDGKRPKPSQPVGESPPTEYTSRDPIVGLFDPKGKKKT
jgi:hypothetical protein